MVNLKKVEEKLHSIAFPVNYLQKKEYIKARLKYLKFLQKTYSWYKNIEDGMEYWERRNKIK